MKKLLPKTLQILFTVAFLYVLSASGAALTVTKIADTNDGVCDADCSLREAIEAAADGDTIEFASPLFDSPQVIGLTGGNEATQPLFINKSIVINGRGANLLTVRRAAGANESRIFSVNFGGSATLQNMTISGGRDTGGGGGILLENGTLTISNCQITGNIAQARGGGIYNTAGTLNVFNSTLNGNTARTFNGGAIASFGGTVNLVNSTVSGNSTNAGNAGTGGIWVSGGALNVTNTTVTNNETGGIIQEGAAVVTIKNSILAANRNNSSKPDVVGAFTSQGYNLIGNVGAATGFNQIGDQTGTSAAILDPRLFPLSGNGGQTPTHNLDRNSPAIDQGNNFGVLTDQRGQPRPFDFPNVPPATNGDSSDIGALERQSAANIVPTLSASSTNVSISRNYSASITFTASDETGETLTFINTAPPGNGTISLSATACQIASPTQSCSITVTYTPNVNFAGADSFQFKVSDGQADSPLVTVNIEIRSFYSDLLVTKTADTNDGACDADCSLREAVIAAVQNENIRFISPLFDSPQTITLSDAPGFRSLEINRSLNIYGAGAKLLTIRRAASATEEFRIFRIGGGVGVYLEGMTITGGAADAGGGILVTELSELSLSESHLTGNTAQTNGGGVLVANGYFNIYSGAITGNRAITSDGGGIAATNGEIYVSNSTVSGNIAANDSGGVWVGADVDGGVFSSTVTNNFSGGIKKDSTLEFRILSSIVAANFNNAVKPDVIGAFTSDGYNLIGNAGAATGFDQTGDQVGTSSAPLDPRLAPLGDFGGDTPTHALLRASPAINNAEPDNIFSSDQRYVSHNIGGGADIGAFEYNFAFSNNPTGGNGVGTLPVGSLEMPYSVQFSAARLFPPIPSIALKSNNLAPLVFSIIDGNLPPGLTLDPNSGILSGTPTQRGLFNFIVKVTDAADGIGGAQAYSLIVSGPTAANVSVAGRVFTPDGRGLRNARVILTEANGATRTFLTTSFGYYHFNEIAAGQTVIIQIVSKRFTFQPQVIGVSEDLTDLNFTAMPNSEAEILANQKEIRGEK